jgi:hypothetical protein
MAIKKNDPPKKGKTTLGAGTGTGITKYAAENAKQKAIKEAARKSAAAAMKKPAAKKPAPAPKKPVAPAVAPKKAAAPAPAVAPKKPANQRAFMDVDMGPNKKGMRHTMSLDTTNMSNPKKIDTDTYNYITRDSTGKVVGKGNIARGNSKYDTKKAVEKLKTMAKK